MTSAHLGDRTLQKRKEVITIKVRPMVTSGKRTGAVTRMENADGALVWLAGFYLQT